jgi:hypothetical protein
MQGKAKKMCKKVGGFEKSAFLCTAKQSVIANHEQNNFLLVVAQLKVQKIVRR